MDRDTIYPSMVRYARVPSLELMGLLRRPGLLSPLLEQRSRAGVRLDLHLRERDRVQLYCGLTRLVDASLSRRGVRISADRKYMNEACGAEFFRTWSPHEAGFGPALEHYLAGVDVSRSLIDVEGAVQVAWSSVRDPWVPFDREAVIGYASLEAQRLARAFSQVAAAKAEAEALGFARSSPGRSNSKVNRKVDQLAVDSEGRLVLAELKAAAASPASVFYSPLQLLQYVHEWASALKALRSRLDDLIEVRVELGLSPADMPRLVGGLRPVIAFGKDRRSAEVRTRFERVREIANRHLPAGVSEIEVWEIDAGVPRRLA